MCVRQTGTTRGLITGQKLNVCVEFFSPYTAALEVTAETNKPKKKKVCCDTAVALGGARQTKYGVWRATWQLHSLLFFLFLFFYPDSAFLVQNCLQLKGQCVTTAKLNTHTHEAKTLTEPLSVTNLPYCHDKYLKSTCGASHTEYTCIKIYKHNKM